MVCALAVIGLMVAGCGGGTTGSAAAAARTSSQAPQTAASPGAAPDGAPRLIQGHSPASTPPQTLAADETAAVQQGGAAAAAQGITQYVVVLDRNSGAVLAQSANAARIVASESIVKLYIAVYQRHHGTPCGDDLAYMLELSDDDIADDCWTPDTVSYVSTLYGLTDSYNDPDNPEWWGAAHVSARDVATLLYAALNDPMLGSWLSDTLNASTDVGSDGVNQNFGFNAIPGIPNKEGEGFDSYWAGPTAIHSVGFNASVIGVVLQTASASTYDTMEDAATNTAKLIIDASGHPSS